MKCLVVLLAFWTRKAGEPLDQFPEKVRIITLPETNSSPLKIDHSKRKVIFQPYIFRCYVSFREGNHVHQFFQDLMKVVCNKILLSMKLRFSKGSIQIVESLAGHHQQIQRTPCTGSVEDGELRGKRRINQSVESWSRVGLFFGMDHIGQSFHAFIGKKNES